MTCRLRHLVLVAALASAILPAQAVCEQGEEEARVRSLEYASAACQARISVRHDTGGPDCAIVRNYPYKLIATCSANALGLAIELTKAGKEDHPRVAKAMALHDLSDRAHSAKREAEAVAQLAGLSLFPTDDPEPLTPAELEALRQ